MSIESKNTYSRVDLKKNNRPFIFLVCLIIATVLWFIKAMEKEYETTISVPVRYANIPRNNILVNPPPSKLELKIRAQGFTLVRNKLTLSVTPVNLNIRAFSTTNKNNTNKEQFSILSDRLLPQIAYQINQDISVLDVSPDTLYFNFDHLEEKKVKVVSNIQINCQNQYFLVDSIRFTPSHVTVRGPETILDTLSQIRTTAIKFNNLSSSVNTTVSLEENDQLEFSVNKVNAEIPISQFTEYNEKIVISTLNTPSNINLITFPGKVNISCLVAFDKFKNINVNDFIVCVDYNDITPQSNTLPVKVIKSPALIKSVKIQPTQVEYIIKEK